MRNNSIRWILSSLLITTISMLSGKNPDPLVVGSKKFTESVILGEMFTQLAGSTTDSIAVEHRRQLGGTRVLWNALIQGEIDIYPEYTGTIQREIFRGEDLNTPEAMRSRLRQFEVRMSAPLGFNNTYALGMLPERATKLGITKISDLVQYPDLAFGFTNEFMDRGDGWGSLQESYQLPQTDVMGLDHDLAYRGIASGAIDVIDMYSTDAEIDYYNLTVLADDRHHFPDYQAVILFRSDLQEHHPEITSALIKLEGIIPNSTMIRLNSRVKIDGESEAQVASDFLKKSLGIHATVRSSSWWDRLKTNTAQHLALVAISLSGAILISIPLGIAAARFSKASQIILGTVGIIQTIPSLALLVFMIPLLGIGGPPAIAALFLYSLLPIVRNTYSGLHSIPSDITESAIALGLPGKARLRRVELPLAARSILAGIKTSAVINVGTATLGALIGAGGYGQPILTGIRLDDVGLILEGAIPAAILALLVQGLFDILERIFIPQGLRYELNSR